MDYQWPVSRHSRIQDMANPTVTRASVPELQHLFWKAILKRVIQSLISWSSEVYQGSLASLSSIPSPVTLQVRPLSQPQREKLSLPCCVACHEAAPSIPTLVQPRPHSGWVILCHSSPLAITFSTKQFNQSLSDRVTIIPAFL